MFVDEPIDDANSRVEEQRAEVTLTHSHNFSPKWKMQASIGGEYSQLSQTGETDLVRDFFRPKGFLTLTYNHDDSLAIRAKLEREVGQLNFFDFISSVSLQDDLDTTGNVNIVPQQSWNAEIEFDKNFGEGTTLKARFYGELISDLVDRIPIGVDGDAVGNIDSATRYGLELTSTIKGDRWGLNGTQLDLTLELQDSSVDDPLLGFSRALNEDTKSLWNIEFRHDIANTNWAYGGKIEHDIRAPSFRLSTINRRTKSKPFALAYIEHKDVFGLTVRATALNLLDRTDDFNRQIFTDRRDIGVLEYTEDRTRDFGIIGNLRVSGSF